MKKLTTVMTALTLVVASTAVSAWGGWVPYRGYNDGWGDGWGDGFGDLFGDADFGFSMHFGGGGYGRG